MSTWTNIELHIAQRYCCPCLQQSHVSNNNAAALLASADRGSTYFCPGSPMSSSTPPTSPRLHLSWRWSRSWASIYMQPACQLQRICQSKLAVACQGGFGAIRMDEVASIEAIGRSSSLSSASDFSVLELPASDFTELARLPERLLLDLGEQRRAVEKAFEEALLPGKPWYLIPADWYKSWEAYVSADGSSFPPGPISTSRLIEGPLKDLVADEWIPIKNSLREDRDFIRLPEAAHALLSETYGMTEESIPIPRPVILETHDKLKVEVDLPRFRCFRWDVEPPARISLCISRKTAISDLRNRLEMMFFDDFVHSKEPTRLRVLIGSHLQDVLREGDDDRHETVESLCLISGMHEIAIERRAADGTWPSSLSCRTKVGTMLDSASNPNSSPSELPCPKRSRESSESEHDVLRLSLDKLSDRSGLCGLYNLGNTCFMNSAIQCLSNSEALSIYFLTDTYIANVNTDNVLGSGGALAKAYAKLLNELWSGDNEVAEPRSLKHVISRSAPQFSGYHQHDSQELLSFLLDGLHEDLNRIHDRPYVEHEEPADAQADIVLADKMWEIYRRRNDSIIVDLFTGQFRSTVVCPDCGYVSVTFDPFLFASLPIPEPSALPCKVTFVPSDPSKPIEQATIPSESGNIGSLKDAISGRFRVDPSRLVVAEIFNHDVFRVFQDHASVNTINRPSDIIFVYELSPSDETTRPTWISFRTAAPLSFHPTNVGFPLLVSLPVDEDETEACLKTALLGRIGSIDRLPDDWNWREALSWSQGESELEGIDALIAEFSSEACDLLFNGDLETVFQKLIVQDPSIDDHPMTPKPILTLYDCLDKFTRPERLSNEDPWYCRRCKLHRQATKKFDLWRVPEILIIHLKRFSYTHSWREKISEAIDFPVNDLDLSSYVLDSTSNVGMYSLYAISEHYGGLGGGHYVATAKNWRDHSWYRFDDSSVQRVDEDSLSRDSVQQSAYMLFYKRHKTPTQ